MESRNYSYFLSVLTFPRIVLDLKYETKEENIFSRLHKEKERPNRPLGAVRIDEVNKKFWIDYGAYKNITTFKGRFIYEHDTKFIRGSFTNSGTWISYPGFALASFALICFLATKQNVSEIFFYFIFAASFHISTSISFDSHIESILNFLAIELDIYPAQGEIISRNS